ncbi:MAG: ATP-binding protein [bacterium]|nr:ATP-binding protein [bacterium]
MSSKEKNQISLLLDDLATLEEYIHDLFNFSPLPVCFVSPIGVILEVNPAFVKTSGYSLEKIVGEPLEKVFKKEEIELITKETLEKKLIEGRELTFSPQEGEPITVQVFTNVRNDDKGETVGYFLSFFDLREIKKSESDLRMVQTALLNILEDTEEARKKAENEKKKTEAVVTNFTDGLLFFDNNHHLVLINPQTERLFKIAAKDIIGKSFQELKEISDLRSLLESLGEDITETFRKELPLNEDSILEVSVIAMKGEDGDMGDLVVLHDISREKMIERLKTEFVSLAAHQLRTPLSAIKWSIRMALDGDLGPMNKKQKDVLKKTYESNERMITLVNDLLNLTRIEGGKYVINLVPVDIVKICQDSIAFTKDNFENKGIKLIVKMPRKKITVMADEEKLKIVIQNLLDNAFKYTNRGGEVSLELKETVKNVSLGIEDTGVGINLMKQNRVFTKFFRSDEAVLLEPAGSGLGLYMAKNIIEGHGGKIGFKSQPGKGTRFFFNLPKKDS